MHHIARSFAVLTALALPTGAVAQIHVFKIPLSGAQEVPANASTGTGNAIVVLNEATGAVTVSGSYANLGTNRTAQHIHQAAAGQNGAVILGLSGSGTTSGTISGGGTLTAAQVTAMLAGDTYINVHSTGIPGGEIRGQVVEAKIHTFQVSLDAGQEVPPNTSTATGRATVVLNEATGEVSVEGTYSGLTSTRSGQHIHLAARGSNGAVIVPLDGTGTTSGTISGSGVLTRALLDAMLAGGTYLNVHSANNRGGEIRGQITQCQAYFKFDRGQGDIAVNYGSPTHLGHGKLERGGVASSFTAGQPGYGNALVGTLDNVVANYNHCDTGFVGPFNGDLTVSWWMKENTAPGTALSYVWGGIASWRCFTNGVAGTTLWMRSWGNSFDIKLPVGAATIQALARRAQGVWVALTVDSQADSAQWYVDGAPEGPAIALPAASAGIAIAAGTSGFKIGKHTSNTNSSAYDIDEFVLCNRLATAAEIKAMHNAPSAGSGRMGEPCGLTHSTFGGTPSVGNSDFGMEISGPESFRYLFVVGGLRTAGFDMGIAFPSLAGCMWYTRFDVQLAGTTRSDTVRIPTPIPNNNSLVGTHIDTQVLGFDSSGNPLMSNGLSHVVERN